MVLGVNPEQAYRSIKALTDVWEVASERMLATVARRLARGITEPGWAERKSGEVLLVRSELAAIVQAAGSDLQGQATEALEEAYGIGGAVAAQLGQVAIDTNVGRVVSLVSRFVAQIRGAVVPVIRAHQDVYQRAIRDSETLMATGTIVRREAVAMAVDHLLVEGEDRFVDKSGRRWHLDSYVRMAGRTTSAQAAVQGQFDGMTARGRDLIVVSDSPRECVLCRPWEGKLLSITGNTPAGTVVDGHVVFGTVAEAHAAGWQHPNCTHRGDPFTPGFTEVPEPKSNPDGYKAAQKLRQLEREARELKRRRAAAEEFGQTATLRDLNRKIRAKHKQIAEHAEATGQNRRRERERPVPAGRPAATPVPVDTTPSPPPVEEPTAAPAVRPPLPADLTTLWDTELEEELARAAEAEDFDLLDAIIGEIERREAVAAAPAEDDAEAEAGDDDVRWAQFEELMAQGEDEEVAVAQVFGKSVEQQRRDRAIDAMRQQGYTGRGFDELARQAYRDEVYRWYIAAEDATRGHMLNPAGRSAGIDPHSLFVGPAARARKWASDELKAWWDANGRVTFDQFVADILGDATGSLRARFRTGGEDWLQ